MSDPGRLHGLASSAEKSLSKSVDVIGFPVAGWIGFALTSMVELWIAGYAEPGFWGTVGFKLEVTGVCGSTLGVTDGVMDFETFEESADEGRWDSFRKLAWRGCGL